MILRVACAALLVFSVAGCGDNVSPLVNVGRSLAAGTENDPMYGKRLAAAKPEVLEKFNFSMLYVDLPSIRSDTFMRPMETNGNVATWVGTNGASLSIVDGIVIATRGYGHDLASSRRPTLDELREYAATGALYEVVYRHWDFEENLRTRTGFCEASETQDGIEELCTLGTIQFANTYETTPHGVKSSRQWVSPERGYLRTIRLK